VQLAKRHFVVDVDACFTVRAANQQQGAMFRGGGVESARSAASGSGPRTVDHGELLQFSSNASLQVGMGGQQIFRRNVLATCASR
jgi:hypothetical protein